jgi:membrane protein required for colicin V production
MRHADDHGRFCGDVTKPALVYTAMNGIDWSIIITIVLFTVLGMYWGVIRQVLSIVGLLVGLVAAGRFGPAAAAALSSFIADPAVASVAGYMVVLALVALGAGFVSALLRFFVGLLFLGPLDHLLGGVFGLVEGVLVCTAVLIGMIVFPLPAYAAALEQSQLAGMVLTVSSWLSGLLPPPFQSALQSFLIK